MSARPKPHRLITDQSSEQSKKESKSNKALKKYSRDYILKIYNPVNLFPGIVPDDVLPLYLPIPDDPHLRTSDFSYSQVQTVNSRKSPKKKPEVHYFESPNKQKLEQALKIQKKGRAGEIKLGAEEEVGSGKDSKIGSKVREGLQIDSNEGETVYMVPVYGKKLLVNFVNQGNPFAKAMIQTGINAEDDNLYFPLGLKPYERVWLYKDPEGHVQGPFSCIEMFNWTLRGCFPLNLQISFANTEFVPMNEYLINNLEDSRQVTIKSNYLEEIKEENS